MKVAVASGKGGTGKTTVATNLARIASRNGQSVAYLDCDVEEPNGAIFLEPQVTAGRPVNTLIPVVNEAKCTLCGECAEICRFSAIVCFKTKVLTFPELCHACGGCSLVCPDDAIREVPRETGLLEIGRSGPIQFVQGTLKVGEAKSPPVIKAVRAAAPEVDLIIVDAPPGTSCPVIESIRGCDLVILVTEPTPFGFNDLKLAVEMVRAVGVSFAVVINRAGFDDRSVYRYCKKEGIRILAEIPEDRRIAEAYSCGRLVCEALPDCAALYRDLLETVMSEVALSTTT